MRAATVTIADCRKNEAVAHTILDDYPKEVSAAVGINALGKLCELLPHEEFVQFVENALHHATTGELPAEPEESSTAEGAASEPGQKEPQS